MKAIIIASGPSLTPDDVERCRGNGFVIVVNDAYRLAPWADEVYACDGTWWDHHLQKTASFGVRRWTCNRDAAKQYGLRYIGVRGDVNWSDDPAFVASGGNSGFQALNLAYLWGFREAVLLGFDYGLGDGNKSHWFGDHPPNVRKSIPHQNWVSRIRKAKPLIDACGMRVTNCSRRTAIDCIERKPLEAVI